MIKQVLSLQIKKAVEVLYSHNSPNIQLQNTVSDFEGDITLVVFPLLSISMKSAEDTANELGKFLIQVRN